MKSELWPDQAEAIENIRASLGGGVKRLVLQAPTGSGKTVIAAKIMNGVVAKSKRAAFVVPAIDLVDQTAQAFWNEGIKDIGVIQGDHSLTSWEKPIQICSIQTIERRGVFPEADIALFDECHRLFKAHKAWLQDAKYPIIGLSATPWTKGLGKYFDSLLVATTTTELIRLGRLSKFEVYAAAKPDLSQVKIVKNGDGEDDYQQQQLSEKMRGGTLVADIVGTWRDRWGQGKTLVFGVDRAHAKAIQERFAFAGVRCGYQDAQTPTYERKRLKAAFHNGELDVVSNVATLTTGVDWDVRCLILARPTKSEMLYTQIIGRALRVAPGKEQALILDHSQTTAELGFVTDIQHEHLDDGKPSRSGVRPVRQPKECPKCTKLKEMGTLTCDNCGYVWDVRSTIVEEEGYLAKVSAANELRGRKNGKHEMSLYEKQQFYCDLRGYALERGYKPGWAAQKYKTKFKCWPPREFDAVPPAQEVSPKTRSWIRSQQIAWAKSKHNAGASA